MNERGQVTTQSWRPQRRGSALDGSVVRVGLIAIGVMAVAGLGYGGYAMTNRAPRIVPVIEADSRPIRIRPDNPGGMQIVGAEEIIMGGDGPGKATAMAPPPEVPQPQILRAQVEAARVPPVAAPAPMPPALPAALSAPAAPVAPPAPEPRAAPDAAPRVAQARPAAVPGGIAVQLGALDSEAAAMTEWQRLAKKMPELFTSRQPAVLRLDRGGKTLFRLRTAGFSNTAAAATFCTQVKGKGGGCSVADF